MRRNRVIPVAQQSRRGRRALESWRAGAAIHAKSLARRAADAVDRTRPRTRWRAEPLRSKCEKSAAVRRRTLLGFVLGLRRRRHALETAQQIFLGHAIELGLAAGVDLASEGVVDHRRRRFRLGLVDFYVLLQRMNEVFLQIARRQMRIGDLA